MEEENSLQVILGQTMKPGPLTQELEQMGLMPTYDNAIRLQMVKKAAGGDLSAAKYVLEAVGEAGTATENPLEEVSTEELRKMLIN